MKTEYSQTELRELDTWIAEHVMGWKETSTPDDFTSNSECQFYRHSLKGIEGWRVIVGIPYERKYHPEGKPFQHTYRTYSPTVNSADAMQVLEKCIIEQRRLHSGDACFFFSKDGKPFWLRTVVNNRHIDGESESLPLAICLFAKQLFGKSL